MRLVDPFDPVVGDAVGVLLLVCYAVLFVTVVFVFALCAVVAWQSYPVLGLVLFPGVPLAIVARLGVER